MKKYMCLICGHIYDEAFGDPDTGIAPGTKWEDVPPNWTCPDCGAGFESGIGAASEVHPTYHIARMDLVKCEFTPIAFASNEKIHVPHLRPHLR